MNQLSPKSVSLKSLDMIKARRNMNNEPTTRPIDDEEWLRPLTMEEIDAMLDEAEADFEAGDYLTHDEVFHRQTKDVNP